MVGPNDIIANGLRRPGAKEYRTGMADVVGQRARIGDTELKVLGGDVIRQRRRLAQI